MSAEYVERLVHAYPAIREVWLIGSRANDRARPESDWDYLAFSDDELTLSDLHYDASFNVPGIDLLVAVDTLNAFSPWGAQADPGTLTMRLDILGNNLDWQAISTSEASYRPADFDRKRARERASLVFRRSAR